MKRLCFTFVVATATFIHASPSAHAWGRLGHRVISRLVEKQLTPKAKAAIAELLEPGESLADASLWADENRGRLPKTAPWHYVDVPLDEPRYDAKFSGDVSTKGCVVDKINEFRVILEDQSRSVEDRRFALRFLIHCVEDMHQPCHVGDNRDKGGNRTQVRFFDRGTNMHALWDTGMIERVSKSDDVWLDELAKLDSPEARTGRDEGDGRGLGDREPAGGQASLPGARDGNAAQVRPEAERRVREREHAGGAEAAVSGDRAAGNRAQ